MQSDDYKVLRAKFLKIFANIPEKIRSEDILIVVKDKPYTWNNAYLEISNDTEIGKEIIKKLKGDLKIL